MEKKLIVTTDGSHSISIPEMNVTYHSTHGAIQESLHVFIDAGLHYISAIHPLPDTLSILEMGFGTGLNALLTVAEAEKHQQKIYYETIELHPLEAGIYTALNYCEQLQRPDLQSLFTLMHACEWNTTISLTPYFSFRKIKIALADYASFQHFHIVYFDAFAPEIQPALWTTTVFKKLYACMELNAALTTYCSKSIVRKAMTEAGLTVEKIPGPPHKREMVRAVKQP
jgi:tRNA U34 5-methylaminomethyl-2-thiouridine-forming methyltransferase MnmC